jgi:dipeptidyl aminopeptidase/acylaminoacyl peptidase
MHAKRTRFKNDILCEFLAPTRKLKHDKVIILCPGMPGNPSKKEVLKFWAKKGYWVFLLRYRGSWESGGEFLKISPHKDVLDILDGLTKGFKDIYSEEIIRLNPEKIYIFGSSFGGPAALLASADKRVTKVIVMSSVVDWTKESREEPLDRLSVFTKEAFGEAYSFKKRDWNKLKSGKFYNPVSEIKNLDPKKIFIIHTKDDAIVLYKDVEKFAKILGCDFLPLKKGGHLPFSSFTKLRLLKKIEKFLKK